MIELRVSDDGKSSFTLSGVDISNLVKGATFELEADHGVPRLRAELDLAIFRDARLEGDMIVGLTDETIELLKDFGWTPPAE